MDPTFKSVFKSAFAIIEKIERNGGEAFIVGGSVRDFLSGRMVGDIDIATSITPQRMQKIFKKVIPVGIEHGTVIVRHEGNSFEVTTYRTEKGYEDFRHPDEVTFVHNITEDLARRDFTMNAIAMDRHGQIVDPYNGRQAIEQRKITAVGNPSERFLEDPLRMMRAVRFASQLNFTIEKNTKRAISKQSYLLTHISVERIAEETLKLYKGEGFKRGLELVTGLHLKSHLPYLNQLDLSSQCPQVRLQTWPEIIAHYTFRRSNSSVKEWVEKWKLSNRCRREAESLLAGLEEYERNRSISSWLVYKLPENLFPSFDRLLRAGNGDNQGFLTKMREVFSRLPIKSRNDLAFQAKDLINLYPDQPKGPWISQSIEKMEYSIVESHLQNDYEKIKEWVIRWNPPVNN